MKKAEIIEKLRQHHILQDTEQITLAESKQLLRKWITDNVQMEIIQLAKTWAQISIHPNPLLRSPSNWNVVGTDKRKRWAAIFPRD